jgi:hypothetical protein
MLPIIQFDPATMSLWYDVDFISHSDSSGIISDAVATLLEGTTADAIDALREIDNPELRGRALQIVSAFIHEKRHFLDFVATNYGAFRFRQFLDVYTNLSTVLSIAKSHGRLCCPLEIYDDPVRSSLMGISDVPEEFVAIARMLSRRRKMVERDRMRVGTRFGPIEIGGETQLEALAYLAQARFVSGFFGPDGAREFRDSLYSVKNFSEKYFSIIEGAARLGLLPFRPSQGPDKVIVMDTALLEAVLFASLQTDYLPPSTSNVKYFASSYPGERFAALSKKILEDHPKIAERLPGSTGLEEAWNIVDRASQQIFGCSVSDQIERDIAHFEKQSDQKIYGNIPADVELVCRDYLALRRQVLDQLRQSPASVFSTEYFVFSTAEQVAPNYVICASNGRIGDPPKGYDRLMGYHEPDRDVDHYPYLKWWWACSPDRSNTEVFGKRAQESNQIQFEHPKSWYSCIDFYAPTAKLLMNGRRIRTMLGPELMFAEKRLETQFGVKTEIFPSFEYPDETIDPGVIYFYYGRDTLKCDLSSETIVRPNGNVLTPWTLRRWPHLAKYVIEKLGGHEVAYFTFVRDWSAWVVSDKVFAEIQNFMISEDERLGKPN